MRNILRCVKFQWVQCLSLESRTEFVFPFSSEHSSQVMFRKLEEFVGLMAEAEKRDLRRSFELKFCRLEKRKEGSEAFSRDWNILR